MKKRKKSLPFNIPHVFSKNVGTIPIDGKYEPYKQNLKPTSGKMEDYNSVRIL